MSKASPKVEPKQDWMAEPGSRRWFQQMRVTHFGLWFAPMMALLAASNAWQVRGVDHPGVFARLVHTTPWILVAVVVAAFAHALWRIEVNIAANERPFTDRDAAVFQRALWIQAVTGLVVIIGGFIALPLGMVLTGTEDDAVHYIDAVYAPLVTIFVIGTLTKTTQTVYKRGRAAYEELEKGV